MRRPGLIAALIVTLAGSFVLTLGLLDAFSPLNLPDSKRPEADRLGDRRISDFGDLVEAAVAIGMHRSNAMKGIVDEVARINASEVAMRGWVADLTGESKTIDVLVFAGGRKTAATQTHGERPDVTKTHKLAGGAEKNVAFALTFNCRAGDDLVTVGLGAEKQYLWLSSAPCP